MLLEIAFIRPEKPAEPALGIPESANIPGSTGASPERSKMGGGNVLPEHFPENSSGLAHKSRMPHSPGKNFFGNPGTKPAPKIPENNPVVRGIDLAAQGNSKPSFLQPFCQKTYQAAPGDDGSGRSEGILPAQLFFQAGTFSSRRNHEERPPVTKREKGGVSPYFMRPNVEMQCKSHENLLSTLPSLGSTEILPNFPILRKIFFQEICKRNIVPPSSKELL
jgi:hypothetical protein